MFDSFELTTPDTIVVVVCAIFAIRGAFKGFVWQAVRTAGLIVGLWAATHWYVPFGEWINEHVPAVPDMVITPLAWVLIAIGIFFVVSFLAHMARGFVRERELGAADRLFGFGLGACTGLVLCTAGFLLWGSFHSDQKLRETLQGSYSVRYMAKAVEVVTPFVPRPIRRRWGGVLGTLHEIQPVTPTGQ